MLRNRDLNVQKNVEQAQQLQQNQKRKFQQDQNEKPNKQEAVLPIKRPPAHLVVNGDITAVEEYVQEIFIYYKNREVSFVIMDDELLEVNWIDRLKFFSISFLS